MNRSLTTVSSRGCPYACKFCFRGAQGERNYGVRTAKNMALEVAWLIDTYGVDFVGFPDDNFAVKVDRCQALPEAFEDLDFCWGTHTRLDEAVPKRLDPMAKAGCKYIGFGAESASINMLERMGKGGHILKRGITEIKVQGSIYKFPTSMVQGITYSRERGVHANCTWIMSYPGETLEDLKTSVAFILWQQELYTKGLPSGTTDYINALASVNKKMFTATAYPGTEMFKDEYARGLLTKHFDISFDAHINPICDDNMRTYVEELDDATKVLHAPDGTPLNFSAMSTNTFLEAREHIDNGEIEKILEM